MERQTSAREMDVQIGGEPVRLRVPSDVVAYYRARARMDDWILGLALMLRLCWSSANRPAHALPPFDPDITGSAVLRELYDRGATFEQIQSAGLAALVLCRDYFEGRPATDDDGPADEQAEVSEVADFSEAPAAGSASR
jgi:hypothetical protein